MDGPDDRLNVEWIDPVPTHGSSTAEDIALRDHTKRRWIWGVRAGAALLVVILVAAGTWYATRPKPGLVVTVGGERVDNASGVINAADVTLARFARQAHGTLSAHSRCYFDRVGGQAKTDVARNVYCGPVLFYLGKAPALYLQFALSTTEGKKAGHLLLILASVPVSASPVRLPGTGRWERPDRRKPPTGADGVVAPGPPPASTSTLVAVTRPALPNLPAAPAGAQIVSKNLTIALARRGYVQRFGIGPLTRSAPAGYKLFAFTLNFTQGESSGIDVNPELTTLQLSIDGARVRNLPAAIDTNVTELDLTSYFVVAVPADVRTVDLRLLDANVPQSLSLLTGAPGPDNPAVFRRAPLARLWNRDVHGSEPATVVLNGASIHTTLSLDASTAILGYFDPYGNANAGGPDRALLDLNACASATLDLPHQEFGLCVPWSANVLSLTTPDGATYHAKSYPGGFVAFNVPASFTTGTITIAGSGILDGFVKATLLHPFSATFTLGESGP